MDMIFHCLVKPDRVENDSRHLPDYFGKKFSQIPLHTRIQDASAILRAKDHVVLGFVNTVSGKVNLHLSIVSPPLLFTHG